MVLVGSSAACGDDGQGQNPPIVISTSDGSEGSPTDGTGDDGLDETGAEPGLDDECLFQPEPGRSGFKYQCEGSIAIDVAVAGSFDGSPASDMLVLEFGHGIDGDSYDEPHVMACCPAYDFAAPSCGQKHEQACMADLAEQGCKSIETNLRDFATEAYGGDSLADAIARSAIHKVADYVRKHQGDCITEFVANTGIGPTEPSCDMDDNGVDYDSLLETGQWTFDPDGPIDDVTISVQAASWTGLYPTDGSAESCSSGDDNDGVLFLEIDPAPESMRLQLVEGDAVLHGPQLGGGEIRGAAALGSWATSCGPGDCSTLGISVDPLTESASVESLELRSASVAAVGTADASLSVDDVRVRLWDRTPARLDPTGTTLTLSAGSAWFAVSAASGDAHGVVSANNETEIVIREDYDGWSTSAFTIAHRDDAGRRWALVIEPAQWR